MQKIVEKLLQTRMGRIILILSILVFSCAFPIILEGFILREPLSVLNYLSKLFDWFFYMSFYLGFLYVMAFIFQVNFFNREFFKVKN